MTVSIKKITMLTLVAMSLVLVSCGGSKKKSSEMGEEMPGMEGTNEGLTLELNGDSDSGRAASLRTVNFAFNSANLSSAARSALENNADFLKQNEGVEVQVEGHCDERGGVQYNIALGEKRARTVKDYLVALGVSSRRISTISFGKERPVAFGHEESSWAQNRRANFVVTAK